MIAKCLSIVMALLLLALLPSCNDLKSDYICTPTHRVQWWLEDINWNKRLEYDGEGIVIGVIDSGIDEEHPDLKGKVIEEFRIPQLPTNADNSYMSHGTAVAGIIVAEPSTESGVLGIATAAKIISIDVTDDANGFVTKEALIQGIRYAVQKKVRIINISIGFSEDDSGIKDAIDEAIMKGIIVVASAGNSTSDKILYPAAYDGVLCVGSYDRRKNVMYPHDSNKKAIYLPGEYIVTTSSDGLLYESVDGTSISTPMLSGIIALMLQKNPKLTTEEIIDLFNAKSIDVINLLEEI